MSSFRDCVYKTVEAIPEGSVMSYGQVAALCNHPRGARVVGQIARHGPTELPWHRLLYKDGKLARRFPGGGREEQRSRLISEGIDVVAFNVDMKKYQVSIDGPVHG